MNSIIALLLAATVANGHDEVRLMQTELVISKTIRRTGVVQPTCSSGCDDLEDEGDDTMHFMQAPGQAGAMLGKSLRYYDEEEDEDEEGDDFSLAQQDVRVEKKNQRKTGQGPKSDEAKLMQMGIQVKKVSHRRTGAGDLEPTETCIGLDCDSDNHDNMHLMQAPKGATISKGIRQQAPSWDADDEGLLDDEFALAQTDVQLRQANGGKLSREEQQRKLSLDAEMFFEEDPGTASFVQSTLMIRKGDVPSDPESLKGGGDFPSQPRIDEFETTSLFQSSLSVETGDQDSMGFGGFQLKRRDAPAEPSCAAGARCGQEAAFDDLDSFSL